MGLLVAGLVLSVGCAGTRGGEAGDGGHASADAGPPSVVGVWQHVEKGYAVHLVLKADGTADRYEGDDVSVALLRTAYSRDADGIVLDLPDGPAGFRLDGDRLVPRHPTSFYTEEGGSGELSFGKTHSYYGWLTRRTPGAKLPSGASYEAELTRAGPDYTPPRKPAEVTDLRRVSLSGVWERSGEGGRRDLVLRADGTVDVYTYEGAKGHWTAANLIRTYYRRDPSGALTVGLPDGDVGLVLAKDGTLASGLGRGIVLGEGGAGHPVSELRFGGPNYHRVGTSAAYEPLRKPDHVVTLYPAR